MQTELSSAPTGWNHMKNFALVGSYRKLGTIRKRPHKYLSFLNEKIEKEATI